jgi:hypothetical protein
MKPIYENTRYIVEVHPLSSAPFWVIDKNLINPIHVEGHFYDEERAIRFATEWEKAD